ncbi:HAD family hydrolase [Rhodobaculum claviforme]|uniref:HAD family hydrolase n=1 Tax=Rhodobaculum claviforme TaxID=1549854 RepID=A0A934WJ97_9RHOB|nr:HAD family hydrolase [Rhodobaculum claviforme]MBK5927811.1 HAD family hydrolase [Rhodobaculum claviforme]
MRAPLRIIGFDADDTLWHNARFFRLTQERLGDLLAPHMGPQLGPVDLEARLLAAERRNLGRYGFGVKGFTLSMIETAIEVTDAQVPASVIADLLEAGREMLDHPIELLPHARAAVQAAAGHARVVLITKGDLLHQERKLAQSGLGDLFDAVEIVSEKTPAVYARVFGRHGGAEAGLMVGDSMRSDVVAAIEAGAWGVHVPHGTPWAIEQAATPATHPRFRTLPDLSGLHPLLMRIAGG